MHQSLLLMEEKFIIIVAYGVKFKDIRHPDLLAERPLVSTYLYHQYVTLRVEGLPADLVSRKQKRLYYFNNVIVKDLPNLN